MRNRLGVPALLLPLALALPVGLAPAVAVTAAPGAARCSSDALGPATALRTKAGDRLGTARMYAASAGDDLGFCVRVRPVQRLRTSSTVVVMRKKTYDAEGNPTSSGVIGGSGSWRTPFLVTGSIVTPGSSMKAVVGLQAQQGAPRATAVLTGTLD